MIQNSSSQALQNYRPLGAYLVEAGLLTDAQVGVALADQSITSIRFGEIVVARGWLKEQTIEFIMNKVVLPERSPQAKDDMQDCLTHRRRPMSGQAAVKTQSRSASINQEGISWIG
jgi:hypothetical protein